VKIAKLISATTWRVNLRGTRPTGLPSSSKKARWHALGSQDHCEPTGQGNEKAWKDRSRSSSNYATQGRLKPKRRAPRPIAAGRGERLGSLTGQPPQLFSLEKPFPWAVGESDLPLEREYPREDGKVVRWPAGKTSHLGNKGSSGKRGSYRTQSIQSVSGPYCISWPSRNRKIGGIQGGRVWE